MIQSILRFYIQKWCFVGWGWEKVWLTKSAVKKAFLWCICIFSVGTEREWFFLLSNRFLYSIILSLDSMLRMLILALEIHLRKSFSVHWNAYSSSRFCPKWFFGSEAEQGNLSSPSFVYETGTWYQGKITDLWIRDYLFNLINTIHTVMCLYSAIVDV